MEEIIPILQKLVFQEIEGKETLPNSLYTGSLTFLPKPSKDTAKENYRLILLMNIEEKFLSKY